MIGTRPRTTQNRNRMEKKAQYSVMNNYKRDKLKDTLVDKFTQIFGSVSNKPIIEAEVTNFLKKDKLNENDLKKLELTLKKKINTKQSKENLRNNLTNKQFQEEENIYGTQAINQDNENINTLNNNKINKKLEEENDLNNSGMSGASDLENFDNKGIQDKIKEQQIKDYQKLKKNQKPKTVKIDYSKYKDEWDAINMYNKKQFEKEKIIEKEKEKEVKLRTKNDLDNQVKQKIKKEYESKLKEQEYANMVEDHLKKVDELERKKQEEIRKRALKEKESRDKQIREQYVTKRIEYLKNKKYERQLVEQNKKDILEEKKQELEKKKEEYLALKKTMKDNELRKQVLAEQLRKEKDEDIRIMEDHAQEEIKRENERKAYFKRIERNANSFADNAVATVLKEQKEKLDEENRKLKQYEIDKENKLVELDKRREKEIREGKVNYRHYLDKQVNDRKIRDNYEHDVVDKVQAKIWKNDVERYNKREKEVAKTIREMNIRNLKALDELVKIGKGNVDHGMSENEKLMNREILEKAYE